VSSGAGQVGILLKTDEIVQAFFLQRMFSFALSFLPANLYGGSKRKGSTRRKNQNARFLFSLPAKKASA
jgi:hypothetical protein